MANETATSSAREADGGRDVEDGDGGREERPAGPQQAAGQLPGDRLAQQRADPHGRGRARRRGRVGRAGGRRGQGRARGAGPAGGAGRVGPRLRAWRDRPIGGARPRRGGSTARACRWYPSRMPVRRRVRRARRILSCGTDARSPPSPRASAPPSCRFSSVMRLRRSLTTYRGNASPTRSRDGPPGRISDPERLGPSAFACAGGSDEDDCPRTPGGSLSFPDWSALLRALAESAVPAPSSAVSTPRRDRRISPTCSRSRPTSRPRFSSRMTLRGWGGQPPLRLILCGSAMSVMAGLLSGQRALRGRAVLDLVVDPFDYREAAAFWGVQADPRLALPPVLCRRRHTRLPGPPRDGAAHLGRRLPGLAGARGPQSVARDVP